MPADLNLATNGTPDTNAVHKYKCQLCPFSADNPTTLRRHKERHGPKTLLCPFPDCDFKTYPSTEFNLDKHINRHLEFKPYKCLDDPPKCAFATCDPSSLLRHRKSHHGYEPKKIARQLVPESEPPRSGKTRAKPPGKYVSAQLKRQIGEQAADPAAVYDQFGRFRVTLLPQPPATAASSVSSSDTLPERSALGSEQPGAATCPIVIDDEDDVDLPRGGPMMPSDSKPCFYSSSPDTNSKSLKMESPDHPRFLELSSKRSMSPPQCFRCCSIPDGMTCEHDVVHVDGVPFGSDHSAGRSGNPGSAFGIKQEPDLDPLELDFRANLPTDGTLGYGSSLSTDSSDAMMVDIQPAAVSAHQPKREMSRTPELEFSAEHFTACQPNDPPAAPPPHSFASRPMEPFVVGTVFYSVSYAF